MTTYYVVETNYVGPNPGQHLNDHTFEITTKAPRTNMSGEVRTNGWLGTTNDWSKTAHGAYDSVDEARAAVVEELGEDIRDNNDEDRDEDVVASYCVGAFEAWDAETSTTWCSTYCDDVTADTTDEAIESMVDEAEAQANEEGGTLETDAVTRMLIDHRDDLRVSGEDDENE